MRSATPIARNPLNEALDSPMKPACRQEEVADTTGVYVLGSSSFSWLSESMREPFISPGGFDPCVAVC